MAGLSFELEIIVKYMALGFYTSVGDDVRDPIGQRGRLVELQPKTIIISPAEPIAAAVLFRPLEKHPPTGDETRQQLTSINDLIIAIFNTHNSPTQNTVCIYSIIKLAALVPAGEIIFEKTARFNIKGVTRIGVTPLAPVLRLMTYFLMLSP